MKHVLSEVISKFIHNIDCAPYGEGHINDTYLTETIPDRYILQRINHSIFTEPYKLMENVVLITEHMRSKILARGGNPDRETLSVVRTLDGNSLYRHDDGNYYRMFRYIDNTITYQTAEKPEQFYKAAKAFGRFQNELADFPAEKLHETIPNFHNTRVRFESLLEAIQNDMANRKSSVQAEIDFALARENDASVIVDAIASGDIPLRVTHNDTKLNNVLFDTDTGDSVCVIDLDTVMPGSLLYDFGDSVRFGASTALEDETDLSKVECSLELFEAFTKGFLEELDVTQNELNLLAFSAKLITFECGIRFLTDYLNGDKYFKVHHPQHNLDRCRTQFKLVADMEYKMNRMNSIVLDTAADTRR